MPSLYRTGFEQVEFIIDCRGERVLAIAEFLFTDFPKIYQPVVTKRFYMTASEKEAFSLSDQDENKIIYQGESAYQLAYAMINEVIFHCIQNSRHYHALHAGAVFNHKQKRCFLLPGKSGSGKSTLTCWLVQNGFQYLTDELVFLDADGGLLPLTRPISLKVGPDHASWPLPSYNEDGIILDHNKGAMIAHRLLNPSFTAIKPEARPRLTDIIFPRFAPEEKPCLREISAAQASLYLLAAHVNARDHQQHGVPSIADISKKCRSFMLTYASFADLEQFFKILSHETLPPA